MSRTSLSKAGFFPSQTNSIDPRYVNVVQKNNSMETIPHLSARSPIGHLTCFPALPRLRRASRLFVIIATGLFWVGSGSAGEESKLKVNWMFPGPSNPHDEFITYSATGAGMVFTVTKGETWEYFTENGTFNETGSSVIALDLKTGKKRWSYGTKFRINSPLLCANGCVVAYDVYGNIFCLQAATGQLVWQINPDTEGLATGAFPQPHPGPWDEQTMPSSKDNRLFLREGNELVCRNLKDGKIVWKIPVQSVANRRVFPAVIDDRLAFSTAEDDLIVFSAGNGNTIWKRNIGWLRPGIVANREFLCFANDDYMQCAQVSDGQNMFSYGPKKPTKEKKNHAEHPQPLAVSGDYLLVHQDSVLLSLGEQDAIVRDPQGHAVACVNLKIRKALWKFAVTDQFAGLSVAGKCVVIVQDNRIIVLDLSKGDVLWQFEVVGETSLRGQPLLVEGKILVIGQKGLHYIDSGDAALTGWFQCAGSALRNGEPQ
jgi:outer membrane protein assembly factor BamB